MANKKILTEVGKEEVFKVAGIELIKFYDENGYTVAVAKDCAFKSIFGENNNFADSVILKRLKEEILPKIVAEVGEENVVEHEVDLLSLDGSDKWGKVKTKISIPTFDFYRHNAKTFDKYKLDDYQWLATADSVSEHAGNDYWVSCVAPSGFLFNFTSDYVIYFGVRPFLIFVSSISVSCEE